ncbi:MAG: hypothetical protein Q9182_007219 [Xanthomendoza sp. 2 TL-2023]
MPPIPHSLNHLLGDQPQPDIVYNSTTGLWRCCGIDSKGDVDCTNPKGKTFQAPAPGSLSKFSLSRTSLASQNTQTSTSSASSQPSTTISSTGSSAPITTAPSPAVTITGGSSNLSSGAKAGISVGVILGVAIIALLSAILYRTSRNRQRDPQPAPTQIREKKESDERDQGSFPPQELSEDAYSRHEMAGQRWDTELDGTRTRHEL